MIVAPLDPTRRRAKMKGVGGSKRNDDEPIQRRVATCTAVEQVFNKGTVEVRRSAR